MGVVRALELVFDDHGPSRHPVASEEVQREPTDRMLCRLKLEIHAEQIREYVDVCKEPWREVRRLVRPDTAGVYHV
ncbi:hypothetical protein GCM10011331_15960 [Flavimobilis marinus]|nr:hypothetical protein GCM10011331_15960 [Flavimobilis marinus]